MELNGENIQEGSGKKTLLSIDDAFEIRDIIQRALSGETYHVMVCGDCVEALALLERGISPDLILLDLMLPKMSGLDFLKLIRDRYSHLKTVVISARGDVETVVEALQLGALDYIHKPFSIDELKIAVDKAISQKEMTEELERLKRQKVFTEDYSILYASREMANIMEMVSKVAQTDVPVLVTGDSGVGKEAVAREIHRRSHRSGGPFLKINCAALPASLLESELFGYNKGAFTGAVQSKPSKFENASGGTIFLDEIGDLAPSIQAKFLHVLQDGGFNRLGSNKTIQADARVLVATNHDLEKAVDKGTFRADLFFRLNVVHLNVPPLKDRPVDISLLAGHFLASYNKRYSKDLELSQSEMDRLVRHPWPGNVRELQNTLRRYAVLGILQLDGKGSELQGELPDAAAASGDLPLPGLPDRADVEQGDLHHADTEIIPLKAVARKAAMKAEKKAIWAALEATKWNKAKAARLLQVSYKALLYKMKDCGLGSAARKEEN